MRNIKTTDLFTLMRIMGKANLKDKLVKMKPPMDEEGNILLSENEYGILVLFEIIEAAPHAQSDIMQFLADVGEVEKKALEDDEFELLPNIIAHLQSQKRFMDFLSTAFNKMT